MWYRGAKNEGAQRSRLRAGFKWSSKVMDCRFDQLSGPENFLRRSCFVRRVCRPEKVLNCGYFERERELYKVLHRTDVIFSRILQLFLRKF